MFRINPDIDPKVHPYVSTGIQVSKFGIQKDFVDECLFRVLEAQDYLSFEGLHCHIGSTIKEVSVFRDAADYMLDTVDRVEDKGFVIKVLDIGGGLGIEYLHDV
jgi:diaminopimelate decarboxylase